MATPTFEQLSEFHEQLMAKRITLENFQAFLRNPDQYREGNKFPSEIHAADLIPEYTDKNGNKKKWEIVEDIEPSKFQVKDLEFISFLEKGEEFVKGEVMRQRAVKLKANLGLCDGKYLLEHQDEIPAKLRGKKYVVLPGTVLYDSDGNLRVPCLCWDGDRWVLSFGWVGNAFYGRDCLARSK